MRQTTSQAPTGLEWAGVALLGLSTAALAGCMPAIYTLWRLFARHGRHHRPPLYYRLATRPVRPRYAVKARRVRGTWDESVRPR